MNKSLYFLFSLALVGFFATRSHAGNPDRQGEAGAPELLMNPWARSSGLHSMTTSMIAGVEAMRLNIGGLVRIDKTEIILAHTQYLKGTDIGINALGIAQKIGKNSVLGISLMSLDFGDIPRTTTTQPEGTGSTFTPRYFNLGLGFSHMFENKVSVGVLFRAVTEGIEDATATAMALDAGVQYVSGEKDNFKFGISLRNIGSRMHFSGQGLSESLTITDFDGIHEVTIDQRATAFELQSVLNIGLSYDFYSGANHRITVVGNYTSNAFSEDQIGGGIEYAFKELVMIRGGYKLDFGQVASSEIDTSPLMTGIAGGVTLNVPVSKNDNAPKVALDYGYQTTKIYDGNHHFSVRITL
ncbi:MAG: PorV/PorQ family protein [Saprospiraceae bacterium]|nr:MAG: PorV/PorQ family protein [Saprospiraceae bacterium]